MSDGMRRLETHMEYKEIRISNSVSISVPMGLTPEAEANFIASRLAFVDLKALEARCEEAMRQFDEGKLIPLRDILEELEQDIHSKNGKLP